MEKGLREFVSDSLTEKQYITVEGSFHRMITEDERKYIDSKLNPLGYFVNCFSCETCSEYSGGELQYHIERVSIGNEKV